MKKFYLKKNPFQKRNLCRQHLTKEWKRHKSARKKVSHQKSKEAADVQRSSKATRHPQHRARPPEKFLVLARQRATHEPRFRIRKPQPRETEHLAKHGTPKKKISHTHTARATRGFRAAFTCPTRHRTITRHWETLRVFSQIPTFAQVSNIRGRVNPQRPGTSVRRAARRRLACAERSTPQPQAGAQRDAHTTTALARDTTSLLIDNEVQGCTLGTGQKK